MTCVLHNNISAVTKDPQAKKDGWSAFEALEFLNLVTPIDGLMARSVTQEVPPVGGVNPWHHSKAYPGMYVCVYVCVCVCDVCVCCV